MLLVAPDPRLGIAPARISRVRTLLDGLPTAPGVAVALPGGPDGELDAVVLRPDGVLGLVPATASRRDRVTAGGTTTSAGAGSDAGAAAREVDSAQELAAAEIDRLLALAEPAPTAPRQVVPIADRRPPAASRHEDPERTDEDDAVGVATAARLVLTASAGPTVLDAAEVVRLLTAWRLVEFVPDTDDLHAAGFPGAVPGPGRERPTGAASGPSASSGPSAASGPSASSGPGGAPAVVPAARSASASSPGGAPEPPGPPRTGVLPAPDEVQARPVTAPMPLADEHAPPGPLGPWVPEEGSEPRRRRGPRARRLLPTAWISTWRGLGVAAVATFAVALGVAVLVVRGVSPASDEAAAQPVRVVDGVSWTQRLAATEPTCEGHAYGLAVQFLRERPCVQLDRSVWSGDVNGTPMVAAVAVVRMRDPASASAFKSLVDSSGTGNVADLLREGRGFPGAPASLGNAGYGSTQQGPSVVIAETAPAGSGSVGESTLDRVARQALALR